MVTKVVGGLVLLLFLYALFTSWLFPHLRRMAFRNLFVNKNRTVLTVLGSMVGTALITGSLLLNTSIVNSVNRVYEERFGPIVSDLPAVGQEKLAGRQLFTVSDLDQITETIKEGKHSGIGGLLPTVSFETMLMKLDGSGKPILLNPNTYIHGFASDAAKQFDPTGMQNVPSDLKSDEIILSERAAEKLEVREGESIVVLDSQKQKHTLKVRSVVAELGITGYRGIQKAQSTAIVSLDTARKLVGVKENGFTNVLFSADQRLKSLTGTSSGVIEATMIQGWKEENVRAHTEMKLDNSFKFLPIFTIVSINAVIIGMALIINIFKMIAEERRQEMGILRALGMNRMNLARLLQLEGAIYAAISGVLGAASGIGIAYLLLIQLRGVFAVVMEYMSGIDIKYTFHVDPTQLVNGFSIGVLLVFLCIWFVSRKAAKIKIVEALQTTEGDHDAKRLPKRSSIVRTAVSLLSAVLTAGILFVSMTETFRDVLEDSPIFPLLIFGIGFLLVIMCIIVLISSMHQILSIMERGFRPFRKLAGIMRLALRYPEVNRIRNGMLIFMFAAVFFLISFSGVVSESVAKYFGGWDAREATGGYDLTAAVQRPLSTANLREMFESSEYVTKDQLDQYTAVQQIPLFYQFTFINNQTGVDRSDQFINGIDDIFAAGVSTPLLKRDSSYANDREAWEAVAKNSDLVILSYQMNGRFGSKKFTVGDMYPVMSGSQKSEKKIIGITETKSQNYGFSTTSGIWVKQSEVETLARDKREIQSTLLIRARSTENLKAVAKGIEKEFTLQNIYPLRNPREMFLATTSFYYVFFNLFEGFTALATLIGIVGLMVVMFRVVLERRQQIGMLRAIGVRPATIYWSILLEGAMIGIMGITLGLLIGAYTGSMMLDTLFLDAKQAGMEASFAITFPYQKLLLYFVGALAVTLLCAAFPARRTLRLTPAEATRYVG